MDRSIDINKIFQRRPAREFLSNYPTKLWNQIIPDVFEIGILNLKNSFGTLKFSRQEFENILYELRNYKPEKEEGENYYEEEEENSSYTNSNNNEISMNSNKSINKTGKLVTPARAEVFIPDVKEIERNIPKIHPRRPYYTSIDEIKEQNKENNRNLNYVESKIRAQVLNDKMIHKAIKTQNNVNRNQRDVRQRNNNMNYAMSFDKNLKMEKISQKGDENNNNYYQNNSGNNFNTFNNSGNNYDNNMSTNNNYENSNYDNINNNNNVNNQDYLQRSGDSNYYNNNDNENRDYNNYNNNMGYQNNMNNNTNYNNKEQGNNLNYDYMNDSEIINNNNNQSNNNLVNNVYSNNNQMNNTDYNDI